MSEPNRLYFYCRCRAQVVICTRCDRGQRYCAGECRHKARAESLRRAAKKYQKTRPGRFNNAARQQRYRQGKKQKVTHHGSRRKGLHDVLKIRLKAIITTQQGGACHYCGAVGGPLVRQDFLRSHRMTSFAPYFDSFTPD